MAPPKQKGRSDPDEPITPPNPRVTTTKTPPPNPFTATDAPGDTGDAAAGTEPRIAFDGTRLISLQLDSPTVTKQLLKTDLKDRYDKLITVYKELEQKFHELEKQNTDRDEAVARYQRAAEQRNRARTALETSQAALNTSQAAEAEAVARAATVIAERDAATAERDAAIAKQNEMALKFFDLQSIEAGRGTPIVEAAVPRKSARMPDAPMFSDGKEVRYEAWATIVRQKLIANADHYPQPVHRMLYVQSRCEGKAQLHIAPRMDAASSRPYEDEEDILEHLKSVFANPNRKAEAYSAYHQLTMKPRDSFIDFLAEFLQLAEEACVVQENRKRDLYLKLPPLLQNQMMLAVNQSSVSFDAFTEQCQSISHEISLQLNRSSGRNKNPRGGASTAHAGSSTTTTSSTSRVKREGSTPARMSDTERNKLISEGRCFK
jgi:Skp family chaperone for outer membrane proteins